MDRACAFVATGGRISYIALPSVGGRKWTGAGFLGTLEGLALWWLLPDDPRAYAAVVIALTVAACWVCGRAEKHLGRHDDPRIVLDEVVGFWWAAALTPRAWPAVVAAFVLFRICDSLKPWPARELERLPGGWGIVADDVGAGVVAAMALYIIPGRLAS
ncbi:MAG: phosphatidylglycerophosphatase A [Elusimicrobiota bacterium]|nr:phosphatidylglycerophosphatase A [Elusimicrobiota bacterium]